MYRFIIFITFKPNMSIFIKTKNYNSYKNNIIINNKAISTRVAPMAIFCMKCKAI